ncbi:MAG TPA: FAD-dependent monooxygenase [Caulobacteraceae bacterium]|nr:FAD-dependent monooxygenase [Caulobacteraceae bacterium]
MSRRGPALIVGAGPAGAALAVRLARAGRPVALLERRRGPHDKVCGEFLSGEAVEALEALGLDLAALGAVPIGRARLSRGRDVAESALPFAALSLSRRRLDEALIGLAQAEGAEVVRGFRVRALRPDAGGWRAEADDGRAARGGEAFLGVGKHDLRGFPRPAGLHGDLAAFKMHWRLAPSQTEALSGAVELMLFGGGYLGLEPIEDGLANLCLVVRRQRLSQLGAWPAVLASARADCALLDRRLTGAAPLWPRPLALAAIPYGLVARRTEGPWPLGDQAAVIPSFAGDGVAIALHSAALAARIHLQGGDVAAYSREMARGIGLRVRGASLLSHALVRGPGQAAAMAAVRARPQLISAAASLTRIPQPAIRRAEAGAAPGDCSRRPVRA